ncbi:nitroreductase family protein [Acinetobacter larvae]|uniref:Putative NAD(P)H nitroreductase n=1 Tax=Acinetobacter larvae TaxID=1789224 RepID=A0A1B2LYN4_9GAMM|nr:nitroreductase family protein [Acinetobacter larvae]AOA58072.1 nitroreductase [Acinetobacter larvae]
MSTTYVQNIHDNIQQRQSIGQLVAPAPNAEQLTLAFQAALAAPDHHRLKPTRFIVIAAEKRAALGEVLSQAMADLGDIDPAQIERVKKHPFRAPLMVIAITRLQQHPKVPHYEQILSSGAAIENFLLSLQAQGFQTMWRTGAVVESAWLKQHFSLQAQDLISGFIYIGTAAKTIAAREEIDLSPFVQYW